MEVEASDRCTQFPGTEPALDCEPHCQQIFFDASLLETFGIQEEFEEEWDQFFGRQLARDIERKAYILIFGSDNTDDPRGALPVSSSSFSY